LVAGNERMHCWVNDVPALDAGVIITLRDSAEPTKRWRVEAVITRRKQLDGEGLAVAEAAIDADGVNRL
jgi:hypothetical protein